MCIPGKFLVVRAGLKNDRDVEKGLSTKTHRHDLTFKLLRVCFV
mgnify:CR=1 FL=1